MNQNTLFLCNWMKKYPAQFFLIPIGVYVSISKDSIEQEVLVSSINSGEFHWFSVVVIFGLFSYEIVRAIYISRKSRSKMPVNVRISNMEKNIKATNTAFFFSMDAFSVWVIGMSLMVIAFGIWNDNFDKASFFCKLSRCFDSSFYFHFCLLY